MFEKISVNSLKYKTSELPNIPTNECVLPALTAGIQNQGLNNYVPRDNATILKNVISISANGANTGATFYQSKEFTVLQDAYAIKWIYTDEKLSDNSYIFLTSSIHKTIYGNYEWTNKAGWERIKNDKIKLPTKNGKIDFDFMESFIAELEAERVAELEAERVAELEAERVAELEAERVAELEAERVAELEAERVAELEAERVAELSAYLKVSGYDNYELSADEVDALRKFETLEWNSFNLKDLFGQSTRGKRLKSADRISGDLPFVTAGEADEGISAYISNDVEVFEKNTTTIDMFGSAKYRNYKYGADDHIAVVHTEKLPKYASIFVTTAIHKSSHNGQFNYGKNFYAKDADELFIQLPVKNGTPDFETMELLISSVHKLVIKDVVLYSDKKIAATKKIVSDN